MRWMGYAACKGEVKNANYILDRMQRQLGRSMYRDLKELWWEVMDSIQMGWNKIQWQALVNMEIYVCQNAEENVQT
jgi:hypothetical protein